MAAVLSVHGHRVSDSVVYAVWSLIASSILITLIQCNPICTDGFYYDDVTGNCDHCSDICEKAIEQRTVEKCQKMCPDFRKKINQKCPPLEYYDSVVGRCDLCASVCPKGDTFDSHQLDMCNEVCPDWPTPSSVREGQGNGSSVPSNNGSVLKSNGHVIVAIVAPLVVALFILVFLLVWMYHANSKKKTPEGPPVCNKRPQQPIQSESHELESLTANGEPLTHPDDEDG